MAQIKRTAGTNNNLYAGPYVARVVSHLDPNYMGGLEVELLKQTGSSNDTAGDGQTFKVRFSSPFYGQTPYTGVSKNEDYSYTQQSYGMWAIPPDVGSRVLVIFVEGQPNLGYWIGCIPDNYTNFTIPDRGVATSYYSGTPTRDEQEAINRTGKVVVGEINKQNGPDNKGIDPTKFKKPINHDWMAMLERAGLSIDGTRGLTSSSARRGVPSMVTGISTPGPYDKRRGKPKVKYGTADGGTQIPFSRLGGTSLVFDDGDENYLRTGPATTHPSEYKDVGMGEKGGDVTRPHNELTRLRTRTGHQILMHNTEDLIYINHGSGNSWIELSANGKIDIYAKDSISVHTQNDLNITADRDINMQAGRNFNVLSGSDAQIETGGSLSTLAASDTKITTGGQSNISTGGDHVETATNIHMNGPLATAATGLSTHSVPGAGGSLSKRMPQHEPWLNHENVDPQSYTPVNTDRTSAGQVPLKGDVDTVPDTFQKRNIFEKRTSSNG